MLQMAETADHLVLFSGDGDFRALVEAVQRKGRRVTVVSTMKSQPPMTSDDLRRQADNFVDLADLGTIIGRPQRVQPRQVMDNLTAVLAGCGLRLDDVAAVRVFLRHFDEHYDRMNAVYATYFAPQRRPARTCVGVTGLARGALVEIDMIARR